MYEAEDSDEGRGVTVSVAIKTLKGLLRQAGLVADGAHRGGPESAHSSAATRVCVERVVLAALGLRPVPSGTHGYSFRMRRREESVKVVTGKGSGDGGDDDDDDANDATLSEVSSDADTMDK